MNDDDFSGLVRSGAQHSVSVSEHTGNAKSPKNIVVSHEEETEARKRAFEQKALAELEAQKALADALAEHTEHIVTGDRTEDANIQKIAADKAAENRQAITEGGVAAPNVQNVSADVLKANIQNINTDKIQANVQNIAADKGIQDNRSGVPTDAIAANRQNVGGGNIAANTQNINAEKGIEANRQDIPTNVIAANVQDIAIDGIAANKQTLGTSSFNTNNQAVGQDTTGLNRQGIDSGPSAEPNLQGLPAAEAINNRQTLTGDANSNNRQAIPTSGNVANEQGVPKLAIEASSAANNQALANPPIATEAAALNRQATLENSPPGINRQGVDNSKIESHFEQLPSAPVERKKVDFPTNTSSGSATPAKATSTQTSAAKPVAQVAAAPRAALTEAEKLQAKRKREQINDAFHGRLAGIKHNVDALNHRLTNFEDKVQKEDAQLNNGKPDDSRVDLD